MLQQPQNASLDYARAAYSRAIIERHPEAATTWADSIEDPNLRSVVLREIGERS